MSKVICVVDDQPSLRQMIRFSLNVNGLQVLEAENGVEALGLLARHDVDMLIIDWQMPGMDGMELIRRLRGNEGYGDIPIVVISCRDDINARKEALSLGVINWLKKPFRLVELQRVVESGLGSVPNPSGHNLDNCASENR